MRRMSKASPIWGICERAMWRGSFNLLFFGLFILYILPSLSFFLRRVMFTIGVLWEAFFIG